MAAGTRFWDGGGGRCAVGLALERSEPEAEDGSSTGRAFASAAMRAGRRGENWGLGFELGASGVVGRSDGDGWSLARGRAQIDLATPIGVVALGAERGWSRGDPSRFDSWTLGGNASSLEPWSDRLARVDAAALPAALLAGESFTAASLSVRPSSWLALAATGARMGGERMRTLQAVLSLDLAEVPYEVGGDLRLELGVEHVIDGRLDGTTLARVALVLRTDPVR